MNASTAIAHLAATMNPAIPVEWPGEQARDSVSQRTSVRLLPSPLRVLVSLAAGDVLRLLCYTSGATTVAAAQLSAELVALT